LNFEQFSVASSYNLYKEHLNLDLLTVDKKCFDWSYFL